MQLKDDCSPIVSIGTKPVNFLIIVLHHLNFIFDQIRFVLHIISILNVFVKYTDIVLFISLSIVFY